VPENPILSHNPAITREFCNSQSRRQTRDRRGSDTLSLNDVISECSQLVALVDKGNNAVAWPVCDIDNSTVVSNGTFVDRKFIARVPVQFLLNIAIHGMDTQGISRSHEEPYKRYTFCTFDIVWFNCNKQFLNIVLFSMGKNWSSVSVLTIILFISTLLTHAIWLCTSVKFSVLLHVSKSTSVVHGSLKTSKRIFPSCSSHMYSTHLTSFPPFWRLFHPWRQCRVSYSQPL